MLWVWISIRAKRSRYTIMWCILLTIVITRSQGSRRGNGLMMGFYMIWILEAWTIPELYMVRLFVCLFDVVVGFTTTYAISAYHYWCCEFESRSGRSVVDTPLCDKVCQWPAIGWWFSLCTLVSSNNKTDRYDITEILLKVALKTITLTLTPNYIIFSKTIWPN
jgi:hypothetical protein